MPTVAQVARALATVLQLLPKRRHIHMWDGIHCDPPACIHCGRARD